jgi:pimeloyl-ACP methyl ester carboxylesterase
MPTEFRREKLIVNGIDVTMLTAGSGEPLLFLHGAGTWHGFDFALPWASRFRVMIPYHPGWGESGDSPDMTRPDDYALHYLELIDQLGLDKVNLVGISMGARFAATFTIHYRQRVRKLVLICPAGLTVAEHPMTDLSKVALPDRAKFLVNDFSVVAPYWPEPPGSEFLAAREREGASFGRMMQAGLVGPWLTRWLHRVNVPAMIVWGDKDRLIPPEHAGAWAGLIPGARVLIVPGAGHLVPDESPDSVEEIAKFLA